MIDTHSTRRGALAFLVAFVAAGLFTIVFKVIYQQRPSITKSAS